MKRFVGALAAVMPHMAGEVTADGFFDVFGVSRFDGVGDDGGLPPALLRLLSRLLRLLRLLALILVR